LYADFYGDASYPDGCCSNSYRCGEPPLDLYEDDDDDDDDTTLPVDEKKHRYPPLLLLSEWIEERRRTAAWEGEERGSSWRMRMRSKEEEETLGSVK